MKCPFRHGLVTCWREECPLWVHSEVEQDKYRVVRQGCAITVIAEVLVEGVQS